MRPILLRKKQGTTRAEIQILFAEHLLIVWHEVVANHQSAAVQRKFKYAIAVISAFIEGAVSGYDKYISARVRSRTGIALPNSAFGSGWRGVEHGLLLSVCASHAITQP